MKKINSLMLGVLVLFAGFFGSCSKDTSGNGPSISFTNDVDSTTVTSGSSWTITGVITSDAGLDQVKYFKTVGGSETQMGSAITSFSDKNNFNFTVNVPSITALTTVRIEATDKNNITNSLIYTIKVGAAAGQINSYTVNMGGSSSSYGSYLDAETGTVYTSSQLNATVDATIDIIFDASKLWNYDSGTFASGTGTKFATTTITSAQFGLITDDSSFASMSATLSSVTVAAGNVVFFTTTGGKKGLALINSLSSSTGNLSISLVVQK